MEPPNISIISRPMSLPERLENIFQVEDGALRPCKSESLIQPAPTIVFHEWRKRELSSSQRKQVKFSPVMRVRLIPTRREFLAANIDLWFADRDFLLAKESAQKEMMLFSFYCAQQNIKHFFSLLYQPKLTRAINAVKILIVESNVAFQDAITNNLTTAFEGSSLFVTKMDSAFAVDGFCKSNLCFDIIMLSDTMAATLNPVLIQSLRNCCDGVFVGFGLGCAEYLQEFKLRGEFDFIISMSTFHSPNAWLLMAQMLIDK